MATCMIYKYTVLPHLELPCSTNLVLVDRHIWESIDLGLALEVRALPSPFADHTARRNVAELVKNVNVRSSA